LRAKISYSNAEKLQSDGRPALGGLESRRDLSRLYVKVYPISG